MMSALVASKSLALLLPGLPAHAGPLDCVLHPTLRRHVEGAARRGDHEKGAQRPVTEALIAAILDPVSMPTRRGQVTSRLDENVPEWPTRPEVLGLTCGIASCSGATKTRACGPAESGGYSSRAPQWGHPYLAPAARSPSQIGHSLGPVLGTYSNRLLTPATSNRRATMEGTLASSMR